MVGTQCSLYGQGIPAVTSWHFLVVDDVRGHKTPCLLHTLFHNSADLALQQFGLCNLIYLLNDQKPVKMPFAANFSFLT